MESFEIPDRDELFMDVVTINAGKSLRGRILHKKNFFLPFSFSFFFKKFQFLQTRKLAKNVTLLRKYFLRNFF